MTIYVDMDGVLADYVGHANELNVSPNDAKHIQNFFIDLKPLPGAIEGILELDKYFDVYILTAASWSNPNSFAEKIEWVKKYLPSFRHRVIFSDYKNLCEGDFLIDDRPVKGANLFKGTWIEFGSEACPNWEYLTKFFRGINYAIEKTHDFFLQML